MQTNFTLAQLADPDVAESEKILRTCVHCGFCTRHLSDLSPDSAMSSTGRADASISIKDMLESGAPASATVAQHIDRCLSCLSCMTTCPSGVNYMHLVDHAPPAYRRDLRAAAARSPAAPAAGGSPALSRRFRLSLRLRAARAALRGAAAGSLEDHARSGATPCCRPLRRSTGRRSFRPKASAAPGWRCSPAAPSRC